MKRATVLWPLVGVATLICSGCATLVPSEQRTEDYTPIFAAASAGDLAAVKTAIDADHGVLRATEWDNATLLHDAVQHNHPELTQLLLEDGADPNAVTKDGLTPLHMAAMNGDIQIAQMLLSHGAKINARDAKGWTPLDRAEKWDHPNLALILRSKGAKAGS
jgi:ankyrin repeat protein